MPLQIPEGFYHVQFVHSITGSQELALCTFGMDRVTDPGSTDLEGLDLAWNTQVMTNLQNAVTHVLTRVVVAAGVLLERANNVAGTGNNPACPPNVAYLIRKVTGVPGRANKGRVYLPGVREDQIDNGGNLVSTHQTALTNAMEAFRNQATTNGWTPVLLHSGVGTPTAITKLECQSKVATQRGRLR